MTGCCRRPFHQLALAAAVLAVSVAVSPALAAGGAWWGRRDGSDGDNKANKNPSVCSSRRSGEQQALNNHFISQLTLPSPHPHTNHTTTTTTTPPRHVAATVSKMISDLLPPGLRMSTEVKELVLEACNEFVQCVVGGELCVLNAVHP
jgi:hypothetical protein